MNSTTNPYSAPATVSTGAPKGKSYVGYYACGVPIGLTVTAIHIMGLGPFITDVVSNPIELPAVLSGGLLIGWVIGWFSRERRPHADQRSRRWVRFGLGVLMGVLPPYAQDLLDWMAWIGGIQITVQLSFYRFLLTIVLSVAAVVVLELIIRRLFFRQPAPEIAEADLPHQEQAIR